MIDEKLESMTQEIAEMLSDKIQWKDLDEEVYELRTENNELWSRVKLLEGRCARSEKLITDLKEEVLQIQSRQMKDNLIFYNIPEKKRETKKDTRKILVNFLKEEMKISEEEMKAVHMDKIHRNGQSAISTDKPRVICASFNPHEGRHIVLNHIKHLDKRKKYGVSEQLPRELSERKKKLFPKFKEAKAANRKCSG